MSLNLNGELAERYSKAIFNCFDYLKDFFEFDLGDIEVKVLLFSDFESEYFKERNKISESFVVGAALNNGRIIVLEKTDFPKKMHKEEEFENVITHELCHIFLRRILFPKKVSIWIQEGICEFLSFGLPKKRITNFVDLSKIKTMEDWDKSFPYVQAAAFFYYLSKVYGKDKIINFLKDIKKYDEDRAFLKNFGDFLEVNNKFEDFMKNEIPSPSRNSLHKTDTK